MRRWGLLILTIALAGLAGFGGAWLGSAPLRNQDTTIVSPWSLVQMISRGELRLRPAQVTEVRALEQRFLEDRRESGDRLRLANIALSRAMLEEDVFGPRSRAASMEVERIVGERQRITLTYIAAVRLLLDDQQRRDFDQRFREAFAAQPL